MQTAKNMHEYHQDLEASLNDEFLRKNLDAFAIAYKSSREKIFADVDKNALIAAVAADKALAVEHMEELYTQFAREATKRGIHIYRAASAYEANELICRIAKENNCQKIIKSKSMTAEETHLNEVLIEQGAEVVETDLAEWIIQMRHEGPSHMVLPAIHLSRYQIADLFESVTQQAQEPIPEKLVKVARRALRNVFVEADMGITGANFAVAENGSIGLCTNEGNARMATTLPRIHVALVGLEKLVPTFKEALDIVRVLPRNATGQSITSYVTMIGGQVESSGNADGKKERHIIFLDNGRSTYAKDNALKDALHCVRCGACANVCPVYRLVGGHKMGHVYIGAIGLILTYFYHGKDKAKYLIQNCINCEACKDVCAAGINLPGIIQEIRARIIEEDGSALPQSLLTTVLKNRKLFHTLLRFGKFAQRPMTGGTNFIRHLPDVFLKGQGFRALPAIADMPFRDRWAARKAPDKKDLSGPRVAIFGGCAQDFIYPEQLEAAVKILEAKGCQIEYPMDQTCCGLPVRMMGERKAAEATAAQNVAAFDINRYDYILTLCPSCASNIKESYPELLTKDPSLISACEQLTNKIQDFSSFVRNILKVETTDIHKTDTKTAYHAPCHLCRGLGITKEPRELLSFGGEYLRAQEEDTCCGFGGSYSIKFPEISSQMLEKKLNNLEATGANTIITDCPGCVMQLRGGEEKRGNRMQVQHMSEYLADRLV